MKRLLWLGASILAVAGFLSACAKAPEGPASQAVAAPYHVGDYELIIDGAKGTGELRPLASTFAPNWGGGTGFTIGVRGSGGSYAGTTWQQNWCVYNNTTSNIWGVAVVPVSNSGTAVSWGQSDNPASNCFFTSCTAASAGPYYLSFVTNTTMNKGVIPANGGNNCVGAPTTKLAKFTQSTTGTSYVRVALMLYEPSGEVVDVDSNNGLGIVAGSAVNNSYVLLGRYQNDPAFPQLGNGNYIPDTGSTNYFAFPVTITTGAIPAHSVTAGNANYANFTIFNTNLGYTILPLKSETLPYHYAVGNFNGSLNQAWNSSPAATVGNIDVTNCNQILGIGLAVPNIGFSDVYNLSLDVLLGANVTKDMKGGTTCGATTTDQYQLLPSNMLAPGQQEYLPGLRTPQVTNAYGFLALDEYWIYGTGAIQGTPTPNTFVGIGGNVPVSALTSIVNSTYQDAPISFAALIKSLNLTTFGATFNVSINNANVQGIGLTVTQPTTTKLTYTITNLDTIGLPRQENFLALNAFDFINGAPPVRLGAQSLAGTPAASIASFTLGVPYTNLNAVGLTARPLQAAFVTDLESAQTNAGTTAVLVRQGTGGNFAAQTFSQWLKLTTIDWTGIATGAGTNWYITYSDPSNATIATDNLALDQLQFNVTQTISDATGTYTIGYPDFTWQLVYNPAAGVQHTFPTLPSGSPGAPLTLTARSMNWGAAVAQVPAGYWAYNGWDSNGNLYDVINRALIGLAATDTGATNSLSMNKFSVGGAKVLCPRSLTYCTSCAAVTVSGVIGAYQWSVVPTTQIVRIEVKYKDNVTANNGGGVETCASGFVGNQGNGCYFTTTATVTTGNWTRSVSLAPNQYNKISVTPLGSGNGGTGGGSDTITFCTGTPNGSNPAGMQTLCTNVGGPLCP